MNQMRNIRIEKVTLNFGAGTDQKKLEKGVKLLTLITGKAPVKTKTIARIPTWGLRPGLAIGCKITLRKNEAIEVLKRLLSAKSNTLMDNNFDDNGNVSFGIPEYIDVPGVKYDPNIGIIGLEASVTLTRPGFRIKSRKVMKRKIPHNHRIPKEDAITYFKEKFNLQLGEEEE
jgi:large subunit ribosomal protein L5